MSDETVLPIIRTRKRRLVAPDKRKKASFSCDRCKVRKIACHRTDPSGACTGCAKAGIDCAITIKRKKKIRGPIENIGLHYKCLHVLVTHMFPDVDANNIDALIDMGERRGIPMPSRYGGNSEEDGKKLRELSIVITSGKPLSRSPSINEYQPQLIKREDTDQELALKEDDSMTLDSIPADQQSGIPHKDYIIMDLGGNSHCIGPLGAPGLLDSYMRIVSIYAGVDPMKWNSVERIAQGEMIISSNNEPIHKRDLSFLQSETFPYFDEMDVVAANHYVDIFFAKVHPRCFCFNEQSFRDSHALFWNTIQSESKDKLLANPTVCCIYMVWILGRLYDPTQSSVLVEEAVIQRYLRIVKLCLSDILFTATLDGIRCLFLLSVYMDNRMRRETGYILIELAARQSITLGLSRKSLALCTENEQRREEIRRTWWSVFVLENTFSAQMGRSSCIQIEDVTADVPTCAEVSMPLFPLIYAAIVELTKILCDVLQYRKHLTRSSSILAHRNVTKALEIHQQLTDTFEAVDPSARDLSDFAAPKILLTVRYHYYRLMISLPLFMHVVNTPSVVVTESMVYLINQCIHLSIAITGLMELTACHGHLNGTLFPEIFHLYHAMMALIVASILIKEDPNTYRFEVKASEIERAVLRIKKLQLSQSLFVKGTLLKISQYIDAFIGCLEHVTGRSAMPVVVEETDEKDYPIVGGPNRPVFAARLRCQPSVLSPPPENNDMDEFYLFLGRLGLSEMSLGAFDFGDVFQGDHFPVFDAGISDNFFTIDGF